MRAYTLHALASRLREMNMNRTSQKILVAGATGFVGRALLAALVAEGHGVRATTRATTKATRSAAAANVEWMRCDVADPGDVERALVGMDAGLFSSFTAWAAAAATTRTSSAPSRRGSRTPRHARGPQAHPLSRGGGARGTTLEAPAEPSPGWGDLAQRSGPCARAPRVDDRRQREQPASRSSGISRYACRR